MIKLIDDQLGRIIAVLEDTGQRDNTLVIFTSDHGETLGDHGLIQKGCRFYEGLVRVPLIFTWPGRVKSGNKKRSACRIARRRPAPSGTGRVTGARAHAGLFSIAHAQRRETSGRTSRIRAL